MGILNINEDSFYDGGHYTKVKSALAQAHRMAAEGADIIDVGAASSKPGSPRLEHSEEWKRLAPVLRALRKELPDMPLSVDTYNAASAEKSVMAGADLINDISGGAFDQNMPAVIGHCQVPYVLMHLQGSPATMQQNTDHGDIIKSVAHYFSQKLEIFLAAGACDLVLDPGLGFGKKMSDNYRLLESADFFHKLFALPVLIGASRKSMLYKLLGSTPQKALNASTVAHSLALRAGAHILRVHDVAEAVEARQILTFTRNLR